jgi:hypothetical protein
MKKLFLALALGQLVISCNKKNDDPAPVLSFNQTTISLAPVPGASAEVVVESNIEWKISLASGADWLQLNKTSGHGKDTIHISVIKDNTGAQARTASIIAVPANTGINLQAQVTIEQKPYNIQVVSKKLLGGSNEDYIHELVRASDGGLLIVAETESNKTGDVGANHGGSDLWLVKLNSNGDTAWTRTMGGSDTEYPAGAIATSDGGFVVAATTYSGNSGDVVGIPIGGWGDFWIIKLKSNGDTAWTRLAGTPDGDQANCMAATPDGGFIVAGTTKPSGSSQEVFVMKLNSNGNKVWQKSLGGSYDDVTNAVSVAADGSVLLAVSTESNNTGDVGVNHGDHDSWIIKLNPNGDKVWSKMFGGNEEDFPASIKSTSDGGCIIAGYTSSSENGDVKSKSHGHEDMWVLKLNASGDISWSSLFGGSSTDATLGKNSIATTADGGYVIVGTSGSKDGDVGTNKGDFDCWVIKVNSTGSKVWSKTYGGSLYEDAGSVLLNADGSFWVGSYTTSNNSGDVGANHGSGTSDVWMIKIKDY